MYLDIIKNPIVLGVLAGAVAYLYLLWTNDKKKNPNKEINLLIPIVIAIVIAGASYVYFGNTNDVVQIEQLSSSQIQNVTSAQLAKEMSSDSGASFHLISKGVNIPNNINVPDVFIETY